MPHNDEPRCTDGGRGHAFKFNRTAKMWECMRPGCGYKHPPYTSTAQHAPVTNPKGYRK